MENELREMLQRGISAARAGDHELARGLLMRVVERDEENVTAWLWLSGVVTNPDDREICLENVLALDPENEAARRGLALLRQQQAVSRSPRLPPSTAQGYDADAAPTLASAILRGPQEPPMEAEVPEEGDSSVYTPPSVEEGYASGSAPSPTMAAAILRSSQASLPEPGEDSAPSPPSLYMSPVMGPSDYPAVPPKSQVGIQAQLAEFDEEYLCPYCAELTQPDDKRCQVCGGQLWQQVRQKMPPHSCWLMGLMVMFLFNGLLTLGGLLVTLSTLFQPLFSKGVITPDQFVALYLGITTIPPLTAAHILELFPRPSMWLAVFSGVIPIAIAILLYLRWGPIYWLMVGLAGINLIFAAAQLVSGITVGSVLNLAFVLLVFVILLIIQKDFAGAKKQERLLCLPDKNIRTHSEFYMHGREYARKKMWTLAAIHFQRAVGTAPGMIAYHLALTAAYARLKRYELAQVTLSEARRLEPDNPKVHELSAMLAEEEQGEKL